MLNLKQKKLDRLACLVEQVVNKEPNLLALGFFIDLK